MFYIQNVMILLWISLEPYLIFGSEIFNSEQYTKVCEKFSEISRLAWPISCDIQLLMGVMCPMWGFVRLEVMLAFL